MAGQGNKEATVAKEQEQQPEDVNFRFYLSEGVSFPAGSTLEYAPTGVLSGVRLPNGELLKPWITWERCDDEADQYEDLSTDALLERGVMVDLDFERTAEELPA